ncbi:hypothetical protein HKX48_003160, partial [Thoreauomyces humboldtii]
KAPKLGKGGTLQSRLAILHSLANVEQWAVDLAWDVIARFHDHTPDLPTPFFDDFVRVASEEAKHYGYLDRRMRQLAGGKGFGEMGLAVHGGLWESAEETSESLLARLAIVHMVHEARGLDVNPATIRRFKLAEDEESVKFLEEIHRDEITHGQRWFTWITSQQLKEEELCENKKDGPRNQDRYEQFHALVRTHFRGPLKPPFNDRDRLVAGLDAQFYMPLASPVTVPKERAGKVV